MRNEQKTARRKQLTALLFLLLFLTLLSSCGKKTEGQDSFGDDFARARAEALPEEPEISGETYPVALSNGQFFGLRGTILCKYTMTEIRATVTNRVSGEVLFDTAVQPLDTSYSIGNPTSEIINDSLEFNNPKCSNSWLNYKLTVRYTRDGETYSKIVLDRNFKVGNPQGEPQEDQ